MNALITLYNSVVAQVERRLEDQLPTLARFTFAATLLVYFWHSATLKFGDGLAGLFSPSLGAYAQIFPGAMEAAGWNVDNLSGFHTLVVLAGTWAEVLLPLAILLGLFTRLAALGMIGFIVVQSLTDLFAHGGIAHEGTLGAWFDRFSDSLILDQRLFWVAILIVLVVKGAGPLSLDRLLASRVNTGLAA
ncbi:DoxX family membrane protein [Aliiroseovarius subalbicans]|uniref:DoxX family membrane protein n=1 Tax=Aliiroseovarius subalbicans TaxID=2925840 RepID=UPI001F582EFA|nr:DoxX family membrane protein [Aliiroseovarius subalbicans]MCI2397882.1 DoxX family membrane protein [Aliiroseovarius subalbicans]